MQLGLILHTVLMFPSCHDGGDQSWSLRRNFTCVYPCGSFFPGEMKQRELCRKLGLSFERMCSSMFERKHLAESLVQVGLLPNKFLWNEWYEQDKIPDWNLVRAAVAGGLFPNTQVHAKPDFLLPNRNGLSHDHCNSYVP